MRILLTGASGYLGRAVRLELKNTGHDVAVLTRAPDGSTAYVADLRDRHQLVQVLRGARFDAVCHLAALTMGRESFERPLDFWDTNVGGTLNLLRAVDPAASLVLASTATVYGSGASGALEEDQPVQPGSPYAASKLAAEQIVTAHAEAAGVQSTVLRCFNIAGAVDDISDTEPSRAVPALLRAATGRTPEFVINGDGSSVRDYTHVADVAQAFRLALEARQHGHQTYNTGTGKGLSLTDLLEAAREVSGQPIPVRHEPAKREPHTLIAYPRLIRDQLGWTPSRSNARTIVADAGAAQAQLSETSLLH